MCCFAPALNAAPAGDGSPAPAPLNVDEAKAFAQSLLRVSDEVAQRYVRPVATKDLLLAALSGLYEEVRAPLPENLKADLEKLVKDLQLGTVRPPDNDTVEYLTRLRQDLGDPEALRGGNALRVAVQAMVRGLDSYTSLVNGDDLRRGNGENLNHGVGLELAPSPGTAQLLVKSVVPGGSAQREGVRPGDRLTRVNGKSVAESDAEVVLHEINGDSGDVDPKPVTLTLERKGHKSPLKISLSSQYFKAETVFGVGRQNDDTWNYLLDKERRIAYVRIGSLEHGVAEDLQHVLLALKNEGLRGLVLDLRWSPGGYLNEAILVARLFLKEGQIASVKGRGARDDQEYRAQGDPRFVHFPLVVLVNGETSGGAELIAAALQDNKRAVIVGQRTFGKASVQTMMALPLPNTGLKLTSGNFLRPNGKGLHRSADSKWTDDWGVRPDAGQELPVTPDLSLQLRDWWQLHVLRPSSDRDVLPVDDPENDPQRQAALRTLGKLLK